MAENEEMKSTNNEVSEQDMKHVAGGGYIGRKLSKYATDCQFYEPNYANMGESGRGGPLYGMRHCLTCAYFFQQSDWKLCTSPRAMYEC